MSVSQLEKSAIIKMARYGSECCATMLTWAGALCLPVPGHSKEHVMQWLS